MRLLLDECVPARLRKALASHQVSTVPEEGWSGVKNGKLLMLAAVKFDALITVDKKSSLSAEHGISADFGLCAGCTVK